MKKLVAAAAVALLVSGGLVSQALAVNAAGCGLGSMVFKNNTKGSQILAATTNATFGNQTFGITSGTSNCTTGGVVKADREQEAFVEANFESLQRDLAAGEGDYLAAFTGLLGCEGGSQPALATFAQDNFEHFAGEGASPQSMLYSMKAGLSMHPQLSQSCSRI
jgi:hypothetical protein